MNSELIKKSDLLALKEAVFGMTPTERIDIFGFRGIEISETVDKKHFLLTLVDVNYKTPRCQIVVVDNVAKKTFAFLASTVPHIKYSQQALTSGGQGANMLMFGLHAGYKKGVHKAGTPTAHRALRQTNKSPIRRSKNDLNFDNLDPVTYELPNDNIHAGWNLGKDHPSFASAGCQTISGYPACKQRGNSPNTGDWEEFDSLIYDQNQEQQEFDYMLLPGRILTNFAASALYRPPLYYGAQRQTVDQYITALHDWFIKYKGPALIMNKAGKFDWDVLKATLVFQTEIFGPDADDGIVGKQTFQALGLPW